MSIHGIIFPVYCLNKISGFQLDNTGELFMNRPPSNLVVSKQPIKFYKVLLVDFNYMNLEEKNTMYIIVSH